MKRDPRELLQALPEYGRLLELLTAHAYEKRDVVLASGRRSNFYIDCKQAVLRAEGHYLTGKLLCALRAKLGLRVAGCGGLTMGADPLASAMSLVSYLEGDPLPAFYVRKEAKGHGTQRFIEGEKALAAGSDLLILEDVITTGGSALQAIEKVRGQGYVVGHVFALVDREEGGREAIAAAGVEVFALYVRGQFPA